MVESRTAASEIYRIFSPQTIEIRGILCYNIIWSAVCKGVCGTDTQTDGSYPFKEVIKMENREKLIESGKNSRVQIGIIPGHFATNHSHVNYYVDITSVKTSARMAKEAAVELGIIYNNTAIDTVICMEGTEILGAFLAEYLSKGGINRGQDINIVTPELNAVNQLIFRDNTQGKIWGKKVLLLIASASTGKSIQRAVDCLQYYSGELVGIGAIFSAIAFNDGMKINALFGPTDLPDYQNYKPAECPLCQGGRKVDALINSFGYSKL